MEAKPITAKVVLATRPVQGIDRGLITLEVEVPLYIWTEILTHRRLSRNASSARAMSTERYIDMGYYLPDTWYAPGKGMQSGKAVNDPVICGLAIGAYEAIMSDAAYLVEGLASHISKEQRNRLIPPIKIVRAVITATEDAWRAFLYLRNTKAADVAMQDFASKVDMAIKGAQWHYGDYHAPYAPELSEAVDVSRKIAIARIARVSYARSGGEDIAADIALHDRLITDYHMSPFEHLAIWTSDPDLSNFTCKPGDILGSLKGRHYGWDQYRAVIERGLSADNPLYRR